MHYNSKRILALLMLFSFLFSLIPLMSPSVSAATEDLTTYTEVDPDNRFTETATRCTVTNADRDEADYVYKDYGINHFGSSWEHRFTVKITSILNQGIVYLYAQSNELANWAGMTNGIGVYFYVSGSSLEIHLRDRTGASDSYVQVGHDGSKSYYMTMIRSGTTLTLCIYNDTGRTDLADTLSITMVNLAYRYLYAGTTTSSGDSGYSISGYIENLELSPIPTITGENPANGSTGVAITPTLNVTIDDPWDTMLNVTCWSNSSSSWVQFATNSSIDTSSGAVNIIQTNSNFSVFQMTYWWSVNVSNGYEWTNETYHFTVGELVIVNASTNIEETSATLNGYLTNYSYGNYIYGFWIGTTTPVTEVNADRNMTGVGNATSTGNHSFRHNDMNLSKGMHYYVKAWVSNATFFGSNTAEDSFWTKADAPFGFTATISGCNVALAWNKGTGADKTTIVRKTSSYPTNQTDGTVIYNNTGTLYSDTTGGGSHQYYRAWSWTGDKHSDGNASANIAISPCPPTGVTGEILINNTLKISWTKGAGANTTVVVRKSDSTPTSITDGTVKFNGTGLYVIEPDLTKNYYFRLWSYANGTYSSSVPLNYGALVVRCYDEETNDSLYFDVFISNEDGSETYESKNNTNPLIVNIADLPIATTTSITVSSAVNYSTKSETFTGYPLTSQNSTTTYVILAQIPKNKQTTNVTCTNTSNGYKSYPAFTLADDVITILADAADEFNKIIVNYTHEEYKSRTYYRDLTTNHIFILNAYLPPTISSKLYLITVVGPQSGTYGYSPPIENAKVAFKRYISDYGIYVNISILYTDANGQVNLYLIPNTLYKVEISKSGYVTTTSNYIPSEEIFTYTFRLALEPWEPQPPLSEPDHIKFTGTRSNTRLYVNYTDDLNETVNTTIYIYEIAPGGIETLLFTFSNTSEDTIRLTILAINKSRDHKAILHYTHTTFGNQTHTAFMPLETPISVMADADRPMNKLNNFLVILIGYNPFGWANFLMFFFLVAAFYYMDEKYAGVIMAFMGGIFLMLNIVFGFDSTLFTLAGGAIPALFLIIGVMYEWVSHKKRVNG